MQLPSFTLRIARLFSAQLTWGIMLCSYPLVAQELALDGRAKLVFASAAEGKESLSAVDEFVKRLSPFDRSARLKSDQPVDQATFLKFVGEQALEWSAEERNRMEEAVVPVRQKLTELKLNFPAEIRLIKTTGLEEGEAAYTRGAAIVLPRKMLSGDPKTLTALMCHELFHVLSRNDPVLRDRLYKIIGFQRCKELKLPDNLQVRRLTNPDGPIDDHCIKIKVADREQWAIPIIYSSTEKYDPSKGGVFFDYMIFQLIVVTPPDAETETVPLLEGGQPILIADPSRAAGYLGQIGRNTRYIIHPDEVLADNFVIIILGAPKVASPDLLERLNAGLRG